MRDMRMADSGKASPAPHMSSSFKYLLGHVVRKPFLEENQTSKKFLSGKEKKWLRPLGAGKMWANSSLWVREETQPWIPPPALTLLNGPGRQQPCICLRSVQSKCHVNNSLGGWHRAHTSGRNMCGLHSCQAYRITISTTCLLLQAWHRQRPQGCRTIWINQEKLL